ncbi:MAG TPA: hypothetical protein DEF12_14525, partial [Rhodobacteraceae bacterium]|nr:hypothetical protein [Paracoccaceae bacterium]
GENLPVLSGKSGAGAGHFWEKRPRAKGARNYAGLVCEEYDLWALARCLCGARQGAGGIVALNGAIVWL